MEIEFFGANCFRIKTKSTTIVVDDNLSKIGGKSIQSDKTVAFYTSAATKDDEAAKKSRLVLESPGEFEVGDVTVKGTQTRAHTDSEEEQTATVYQFMVSGLTVTVLGHVHPNLSDEVLEAVGGTDVLILPVGGNGFTLDKVGAMSVIKSVEPSVVIPSQYEVEGLNYEVPAETLDEFNKVSSFDLGEQVDSYKVTRSADDGKSQTRAVVLKVNKK